MSEADGDVETRSDVGTHHRGDTEVPAASTKPRYGHIALRACVAVFLLAAVVAWVGPQRLAAQLRAVDAIWFGFAVVCAIAANLVSAWRWAYIARALGLRVRLPSMVTAYAQGLTVNILLPGATIGGDALRSVRVAALGNPLAPSALSVLLDRASGLWVLCAMSLMATAGLAIWALGSDSAFADGVASDSPAALIALAQAAGAWGLALYVMGLFLAVCLPFLPWRMPALPAPVRSRTSTRARWMGRLAEMHELVVSRRAALLRSLPHSVGVQLLSAGTLWLCARAAGAEVGYLPMLAIAAPIFVAAALPVSLGGFGPREFAAALVFPMIGAGAHAGVAAAALYGLAAVAQGVLAAPLLALDPSRK